MFVKSGQQNNLQNDLWPILHITKYTSPAETRNFYDICLQLAFKYCQNNIAQIAQTTAITV